MKKAIIILLAILIFIAGCVPIAIKDIKENEDEYIGQKVSVEGTATGAIRLGKLSGFTLKQDDGSKILVSSQILPQEDMQVMVKGTVMKDTLFGLYILADNVYW